MAFALLRRTSRRVPAILGASQPKSIALLHRPMLTQYAQLRFITHVASKYKELVNTGVLHPSKTQQSLINRLDDLAHQLEKAPAPTTPAAKPSGGFFGGLFGGGGPSSPPSVPKTEKVKSLYIWGGVGVGKTYCMDLFYREVKIAKKRRIHFHHFMLEVHSRIHRWRSTHSGDPVVPVANDIATETKLLCFDEFQVSDIADATIMSRLFSTLFDKGEPLLGIKIHLPVVATRSTPAGSFVLVQV